MKKRKFFSIVALSLMVSGNFCVASEKVDARVSNSDSLSVKLQEVAVVASRASEKTPIAFTNITADELANVNNGQDLPYLLSMTPSLISTSDAGANIGYTSLRVRGSDGSRINITANGVPVNDSESHNVFWVNMPDFASSVNDIQLQRGAGTSTNGAGAFGASINMTTAAPSAKSYAEFDGSYGMYNTHKETFKFGSGLINGHWAFDARISNIGTDGYIQRASSEMYSYFAQAGYYSGSTSVRLIAFGGKQKTYMAWDYASKEQMEAFGRDFNPCGIMNGTTADGETVEADVYDIDGTKEFLNKGGRLNYYDDQTDNYIQHHFQLHLNQRLSSDWNLNVALHYTKGDGFYKQYKGHRTLKEYGLEPFYVDGEKVKKSDLIRMKNMDNGFGGGLFNFTYRKGRVNAVFGGAANYYGGYHFGNVLWVKNYMGDINPNDEYYRNLGEKVDANVYARANVDIVKGLSGYVDLQYRYINYKLSGHSDDWDWNTDGLMKLSLDQDYNFFNPKVGFNYAFAKNHRAFASFSVAHKEPTRNNFVDGDINHLPSAERLFDYELGYTFSNSLLSAGINLYYMDYKDQLVLTGELSDTGNPVSENVPDSYRMGAELQFAIRPCNWFDWDINATFSRNRIKDFVEVIYEDEWQHPEYYKRGDTPIAYSPDIVLHNSFNFHWKGLDASLQSQYVSKQYLNNAKSEDTVIDPYFVSNLHLGYTFENIAFIKNLRLGFSIYNIFNEEYENNGFAGAGYYKENGENVIYRYAGYAASAPTNVMGSISIRF